MSCWWQNAVGKLSIFLLTCNKFHDLLNTSELASVFELIKFLSEMHLLTFFKSVLIKKFCKKISMGIGQKVQKLHSTDINCGD